MRRTCAYLLFGLSAVLFSAQIVGLPILWKTALSYKLHHEAAAPLCLYLVWAVLALAAYVRGAQCLGRGKALGLETEDGPEALLALVPLLLCCAYLFENEFFYTMFDPKGYPVHPPEIAAHPRGGWVTPRAHLFASAALLVSMAAAWWVMRRKSS